MSQHSLAYINFIKQITIEDYVKFDSYNSKLLREINPNEIDEIENIIWEQFHDNVASLAVFLPELVKYDGISELKKYLNALEMPCGNGIKYGKILYMYTGEAKYLFAIATGLGAKQKALRLMAINELISCKPSPELFDLCKKTYIKDSDKVVRDCAINGMLYCKGIINSAIEYSATSETEKIKKKLNKENLDDRIDTVNRMFSK
ncbi:MAG TPA: hypothetical protein VHO94_00190 [Oscillospiraceae bacterium]|nr:hypothetical protein [Oscillospiraceae bacterium]